MICRFMDLVDVIKAMTILLENAAITKVIIIDESMNLKSDGLDVRFGRSSDVDDC